MKRIPLLLMFLSIISLPMLINTTPLFDYQFYINPYGPNDPYGVE